MSLMQCDYYTRQEIMSKLTFESFKTMRRVCSGLYNMHLPRTMVPKKMVQGLYLYENECSVSIERKKDYGTEWVTVETTFDCSKNINITGQDFEGAEFEHIGLSGTNEDVLEKFVECLEFGNVLANSVHISNIPEKWTFKILDNVFGINRVVLKQLEYTPEMCQKLQNLKVEDIWVESVAHDYEIFSHHKSVLLLGAEENVDKIHDVIKKFYCESLKFPQMLTLTLKTGMQNANMTFLREVERQFPLDKFWIFDDFGKTIQPEKSLFEFADRDNMGMEVFLQNAASDDVIRIRESIATDSETLSIDITHFEKIPSVRL